MDYNKVIIIGRLGADPELKTQTAGSQSMIFSVANSIPSKNQETGEMVNRTIWHKVTVWGDRIIQKCLSLSKGDTVLIEGYLDYSPIKKENSQTENAVSVAKIIVSSFKYGRVEIINKKGIKTSEESVSTNSSKNSFYSNGKGFKDKKESDDFLEEDSF